MNISRYLLRLFPLALPLVLSSGCVTKALWTNGNLEAWNEPATDVNLRLFDGGQRNDVLVVYNEYAERSGVIRSRAYWLSENQPRVNERRKPHFVNANGTRDLSSLPILHAPANPPLARYAIFESKDQSFTLYTDGTPSGPHNLPVYNDHKGKVEKAILTPPAVTADLTIVGGVLGYFYLAGLCGASPAP